MQESRCWTFPIFFGEALQASPHLVLLEDAFFEEAIWRLMVDDL